MVKFYGGLLINLVLLEGLEGGVGTDDSNSSNNNQNDNNTDSDLPILSVSEALRQHGGALKVYGMISSLSPLCKMIRSRIRQMPVMRCDYFYSTSKTRVCIR